MFSRETVFILGAGASWHYGYPTGEELVRMVIDRAMVAEKFFKRSLDNQNVHLPEYIRKKLSGKNTSVMHQREAWQNAIEECQRLARSLKQVNPLVIDYFLGQNKGLQEIGKLIIAWVILECEATYIKERGNINRRLLLLNSPKASDRNDGNLIDITKCNDDWGRFVLHKMVSDCSTSTDLNANRVSFITFNYDISLEHKLYRGLHEIEQFNEKDVRYFLSDERIIHIYGKIFDSPAWESESIDLNVISNDSPITLRYNSNPNQYFIEYQTFLDTAFKASQDLRVISDDKGLNEVHLKKAREVLSKADDIYILGFGFDPQNSRRIGLEQLQLNNTARSIRVFFTNFGDRNSINKKAGILFQNDSRSFLPPKSPISSHAFVKSHGAGSIAIEAIYEKSNRDVYEALERDFEL